MFRRSSVLLLVCAAALAWSGAVSAQNGDYTAAIHAGMCGELGEEVESLDAPSPKGTGADVGVEGTSVVYHSDTDDDDIAIPDSELVNNPHSIVVFDGDTPVACGEIGGNVHDGEDLWIALHEVDDSGYTGVAELDDLLDDDDDEVEIDLYVVQPTS